MSGRPVVAVIQARMGSTRLPGKVALALAGRPVLAHVIERVAACRALDGVWVATSVSPADEPIVEICQALAVPCHRGPEDDVLARYLGAAGASGAQALVRVTADCPLFDPEVLEAMLERWAGGGCDYLSNTLERSYPRGLDAEVFSRGALEAAAREAREPHEREHVTPFLYQHPERFRLCSQRAAEDHSRERWTLDTAEDWALIQAVYAALHRPGRRFTTAEVLELLDHRPELRELNAGVEQKPLGG